MTTLRKRIRIAAPPSAVHRALTDPAAIDADRLAVYASLTEPEQYSQWC